MLVVLAATALDWSKKLCFAWLNITGTFSREFSSFHEREKFICCQGGGGGACGAHSLEDSLSGAVFQFRSTRRQLGLGQIPVLVDPEFEHVRFGFVFIQSKKSDLSVQAAFWALRALILLKLSRAHVVVSNRKQKQEKEALRALILLKMSRAHVVVKNNKKKKE